GPDKPAGRNPETNFKGEKRSNATHHSTTDPQARLYKKGEFTEAKLRYMTHALSENRNGLVVDVESTQASGSAVDGRTARGKGYAMSLRRRKMIEEAFGWIKTVGGLRKTRHKGLEKLSGQALFAFAAYNLTRLLNLMRPAAA
ncbi:MAG: transposase, partial [Gammaproteobacteria bacterium]|nr:transposase [Gammaproteobacteria bacterium]